MPSPDVTVVTAQPPVHKSCGYDLATWKRTDRLRLPLALVLLTITPIAADLYCDVPMVRLSINWRWKESVGDDASVQRLFAQVGLEPAMNIFVPATHSVWK